jgi:hypothetical protein
MKLPTAAQTDRRWSPRYKFEAAISVWPNGKGPAAYKANVGDMSRTGIYFVAAHDLQIGSRFDFEVKLPGSSGVLVGQAKLVRKVERADGGFGIAGKAYRCGIRKNNKAGR